jgi:acyl dehydratase
MTGPPRWETLAIGDVHVGTIGPVGVADFVRYAGASGDFNPLHYDPDYARAAGFPSVFAQGMFHAGVLGSLVAGWLGPEGVRRFQVRFLEVVWPGDTLTLSATITAKLDLRADRQVQVALSCERQTGSVAAHGSATFALDGPAGAV